MRITPADFLDDPFDLYPIIRIEKAGDGMMCQGELGTNGQP
jgi:hypothetical protein